MDIAAKVALTELVPETWASMVTTWLPFIKRSQPSGQGGVYPPHVIRGQPAVGIEVFIKV